MKTMIRIRRGAEEWQQIFADWAASGGRGRDICHPAPLPRPLLRRTRWLWLKDPAKLKPKYQNGSDLCRPRTWIPPGHGS